MSAVFLAACAARGPAYELQITGLAMHNQTRSYVTAARLLVPATGSFVSCGNIAPGGVCSSGFPETTFTGNPVEIHWSQNGQIWSTGELAVKPGEDVLERGSATVMVIIAAPGSAGLQLIADPARQDGK